MFATLERKSSKLSSLDGSFYHKLNGSRGQTNHCKPSMAGFTLLELLLVLVIFSFTVTLVVTSATTGLGSARLKTTAKRISRTLTYARNLAISERRVYYGHVVNDRFVIAAVQSDNRKMEVLIPEQLKVIAPQEDTVFFYPRGDSSGGLFEISALHSKSTYSVKVEPATGRVRLSVL